MLGAAATNQSGTWLLVADVAAGVEAQLVERVGPLVGRQVSCNIFHILSILGTQLCPSVT